MVNSKQLTTDYWQKTQALLTTGQLNYTDLYFISFQEMLGDKSF